MSQPLNISSTSSERRDVLVRRIRVFVACTIACNVIEAVLAMSAGLSASSSALIGFGLDSIIEVSSAVAVAVAWQFSGDNSEEREWLPCGSSRSRSSPSPSS